MKRIKLVIGDIFEVPLEANLKGYFQFIAIDENQLRSDVIRVFSRRFLQPDTPDLEELVNGTVDFYSHCVIRVGLKHRLWEKAGRSDDIGPVNVIFRSTKDFGRDWIKVSERWEVWKIGQPRQFVGKLPNSLQQAEYGTVFPPADIIYRMKHGRYEQRFHS